MREPEPASEQLHKERLASAPEGVSSLADRIQAQREQIFKAIAIVECCRYANATLLEVSGSEYIVPAFEAVCDLLDTSASELELIAEDCEPS